MTKYFLLCAITLLTSCGKMNIPATEVFVSPRFKVGDCIVFKDEFEDAEFLKQNLTYRKILRVGKQNYLYKFVLNGTIGTMEYKISQIDESSSIVVPCPTSLK